MKSKSYLFLEADTLKCTVHIKKPLSFTHWERIWRPTSFPDVEFHFLYGIIRQNFFSSLTRPVSVSTTFVPTLGDNALNDMSIIKSLLQKSIRRQDEAVALSAAKTFMTISMKSFLRRLIIICAEDVFLDPGILCTLVFLFKACENTPTPFKFTKEHYSYLLGIVRTLCQENHFEHYSSLRTISPISLTDPVSVALHIFVNSTDFFLPGDKLMLIWYHENLVYGSLQRKWFKEPVTPVPFSSIPFIFPTTCPLYAVDFHTHTAMVQYLARSSKLDEKDVRYCVWNFRSKLNKRKLHFDSEPAEQGWIDKWELIKDSVDSYSRKILSSFSLKSA